MLAVFKSEQSSKTPFIELNGKTGVFEIKGRSIPEDTVKFYKPLLEWIDSYSENPCMKTALNIQLDYFNTSSAKVFADFFKKMSQLNASLKSEVAINWYYQDNDDDIMEAGEDFQSIIKVPFNLISFSE